ncbi:MAG: hypothetical protein O8C64_01765 [Candidatus Methanoperedens sp.]|nr:hypothetical protein [Candidatus Methanoperedens sp.]MCZ7403894.1 hypothetical protein [Candidatus Methanoperedens sp.]
MIAVRRVDHRVGYELLFINEHEKAYTMVGVEHGFTQMVRISTDKKSVGIRRKNFKKVLSKEGHAKHALYRVN